jgi:hypothetical protein
VLNQTAVVGASMDEWIAEYRSELLSGDALKVDTLARIIQRIENVYTRDLQLVRTLTASNVNYLNRWQIDQVIEAELDQPEIENIVRLNKYRYARIAPLLQEVVRRLDKKSNFCLRYTIQTLNDLAHDFSVEGADFPRRDKVLNDRIKKLARTRRSIETAIAGLRSAEDDHLFAQEYQGLVAAPACAGMTPWGERWWLAASARRGLAHRRIASRAANTCVVIRG